jgi:hypothetical protein
VNQPRMKIIFNKKLMRTAQGQGLRESRIDGRQQRTPVEKH